jgi:competence protein ComEC
MAWLDDARRHPRHLLLGGVVAGLAFGALAPGGWPVAAVAAALAVAGASPWLALWVRGGPPSPPVLGVGMVVAVAVGAAVAHARTGAIDATALTPLIGRQVHMTATVLEPPERKAWGTVVAPAALENGERVVLRLGSHGGVRARWPRSPTGAEVRVRGRMRALGPADEHERRRGAHAQISVDRLEPTGRRRGGVAGALDGVRRRAEDSLSSALPASEAALGRGMVLGQDDALADDVREDFRTSGLAHLLR